ncbi:MAG: ADP-ribosylglycohydrolase family protein [Proteobacteria bacterium]|nr:ADP-ribosylglycohydrolase family protein [Pseudomonadota bacterium]MBU1058506.1 ADP-ribosylglycohydrolase family protein [Pseudomonadota bacterium]
MDDKARAMVLASFAADALALGAHWIYETERIEKEFGRVENFFSPLADSYHPGKRKGDFTHYGDQALVLLQSVAAQRGFVLEDFSRRWQGFFADCDAYVDAATREALINFGQGTGPENSGSHSSDLGGVARIAALAYRYRDDFDGMSAAVHAQTAMTHAAPAALAGADFLSRTLFAILQGAAPKEAMAEALAEGVADMALDMRLAVAFDSAGKESRQVIGQFGQMCTIVSALPGVVHLVLTYGDDLRTALIENVMAGGDSAARGMVTGMILGASLGLDAVPLEWLQGMNRYLEINDLLATLEKQ